MKLNELRKLLITTGEREQNGYKATSVNGKLVIRQELDSYRHANLKCDIMRHFVRNNNLNATVTLEVASRGLYGIPVVTATLGD